MTTKKDPAKKKQANGAIGKGKFDGEQLGSREKPFDCAVIGGGPAGLSSAIYLGRLRRSSVVFDDHSGRSLWSQVNHNYLGFPDGVEATELRRLGRLQAARYGAEFCKGQVERIKKQNDLFVIQAAQADEPEAGAQKHIERDEKSAKQLGEEQLRGNIEMFASSIILATGVKDHFPEFVGRDECVGVTLFWCTICDGYEALGKSVVVLGKDEEAASTALQLRQFSDHIALVANAEQFEVPDTRLKNLHSAGIETFAARVTKYENKAGCLTALKLQDEEKTSLPLDLLFTVQRKTPNTTLAVSLGVAIDEAGYIKTDSEQKTNIAGVYAAGDVTRLHNHQVTSAVHEGGMAAAGVNFYLYGRVQKPKLRA